MKTMQLTAQRARSLFRYDAATGDLKWTIRKSGKIPADLTAGYLDEEGYRVVRVDGVNYRAHRVIWLIVFGKWPKAMLDHKNGDRSDNRLKNLREASNSQNQMNKVPKRGSQSGFKGVVVIRKPYGLRYRPQIYESGKLRTFGLYRSAEEAHAVYQREAAARFRDFARFK